MANIKKGWNDLEKYQLWLGHLLKVPAKVSAMHFQRSVDSINKAIERLEISPTGCRKRGVKKGSHHFDYMNLKDFQEKIIEFGLYGVGENASLALFISGEELYLNPRFVDKWKTVGLAFPAPWKLNLHRLKSLLPKRKPTVQEIFGASHSSPISKEPLGKEVGFIRRESFRKGKKPVSLEALAEFIETHRLGMTVKKRKESICFTENHAPLTIQQALYRVNKYRERKRLNLYCIDNP